VLGFDSVIFSLTLYKAFTIGRGVQLLNVIVRDGASSSGETLGSESHHPCQALCISRTIHSVCWSLKSLKDSEQGTVLYESREYYDPPGVPRFLFTNIQAADLPIFPSLPRFVVMHFY
jgi:hypothetical protein